MKLSNKPLMIRSKSLSNNDTLYLKYLDNQSFRGFYYDSEDRSYGIVLEFGKNMTGKMNLFAQVLQGNISVIEYRIQCDTFSIETLAYDKILIHSSAYKGKLLVPDKGVLKVPETLEFTVQVLTRNAVYIQFRNHEAFTAPISSFKGGLVLALDQRASRTEEETEILQSAVFTR
jgi:hypothetical protein